jgi:RNA-directed DNA polymerase
MIRGWLKAGVMEEGRFAPTGEGTPQGGVISPLLLNIALHGMSAAAGCLEESGQYARSGAPVLIRYADDFIVFCHSEKAAHQARQDLARWLAPKGLAFNEEKTRVVRLDEGFDFLGFNIRRYSGKLLIKPSRDAIKKIRIRLRDEVRALRGSNAKAVVKKLNPVIKGRATYYRSVVSSRVYGDLDNYMWQLTYKWAKHSHPKKARTWVTSRYFGQYNATRTDRWVFGDRDTCIYLFKFGWTRIERHVCVAGANSRDDPRLADYWAARARKMPAAMDRATIALAARQKGVCVLCKQPLIFGADYEPGNVREWAAWFSALMKPLHKHHFVYRRDGGTDNWANLRLVHAECHRQHHAADSTSNRQVTPTRAAIRPA